MNIVIAHESVDTTGGVETYLSSIVPALQARGHRVVVLHHRRRSGGGSTLARLADTIGVEELGLDEAMRRIRRWKADLCFSHNMSQMEVERRIAAERPVVKMMHGYFGTCISGLKCHRYPSMQVCGRRFGAACVALYAPRRCGQMHPMRFFEGFRHAREQNEMFSRYASMVVASDHMRAEYARNGVADSRLHVLPLFSGIRDIAANIEREPDTVLFAGRMTHLKGGDLLIDAAARGGRRLGRSVRLLMVGDGPPRRDWERQALRAGVPAEFTGWIPEESRAAIFARAAIAAVPSVWPEPFGLIGLEAASLGIPAVAFDTGGISTWLRHEASGTLVPPREGAQGLARALADLLADHGRRRAYGAAAHEISLRMSLDAHVSPLVDVLHAAAGKRSPCEPAMVPS